MKKLAMILGKVFFLISIFPWCSVAKDYPTRPITMINCMPAGGSWDVAGRSFAAVADKYLGQPIVVINKPGATGMIGTQGVVQAPPDGYTIGVHGTAVVNAIEWEIVNQRKPLFTRDDLTRIGNLVLNVAMVVVPYNSPWKTLADLIKDCKEKPNFFAFGSGGLYGGSHLPGVVLMKSAGITARHVPYKGGGEVMSALVGGHIDFATQWGSTSIPLMQGKKLRILAVQGETRLKVLPDIPTLKELGILNAEWTEWIGVCAPRGLSQPALETLQDVVKKTTENKIFVDMTTKDGGSEVYYMNSNEVIKRSNLDAERVAKIYKQLLEEKN